MLSPLPPRPGLLFSSFLYRSDLFSSDELSSRWEALFGLSFSYSPKTNPLNAYYASEMGEAHTLKRVFFVTGTTYAREYLLTTKLQSLVWEKQWSFAERRKVNIDVGLITLENFTLATTKNYSHRIYLGQNIFADLTYQFQHGKLVPLPWTYPDYRDEDKVDFISWARSYLLNQLI